MANVLDTPEQIDTFRFFTIYRALKLEVETGLKMTRGSVLQALNGSYGTSFRSKKKALAWCEYIVSEIEAKQAAIERGEA